MDNDRELAKQIIREIIRQGLPDRTKLDAAFYHAHLRFADTQPAYLSSWPIVRLPSGPGIGGLDGLLRELTEIRRNLSTGAIEAITYGVEQASKEDCGVSRAWREAQDGEELHIYLDSLDDDEYRESMAHAEKIGRQLDAVLDGAGTAS